MTTNLSNNNITFIFQACNKIARLIILHLFSLLKSNNGFTSSFNKPQKNLAMINLIFCTIVFAIIDATERLQKYYLQMYESNKNLINFLKHFILFCFFEVLSYGMVPQAIKPTLALTFCAQVYQYMFPFTNGFIYGYIDFSTPSHIFLLNTFPETFIIY